MTLRKLIESQTGPFTDEDFKIMCAVLTSDIKFNRIGFKQPTYISHIKDLATWYSKLN